MIYILILPETGDSVKTEQVRNIGSVRTWVLQHLCFACILLTFVVLTNASVYLTVTVHRDVVVQDDK